MTAEPASRNQFGDRCLQMRALRNLSQTDLCMRADISNGVLSSIENHRRSPTVPIVVKVCLALEVSADYMLGIANDNKPVGPLAAHLLRNFSRLSTSEQEILVKLCAALAADKIPNAPQVHKLAAVG
jgi:transcriptional regulator with XRE-family HTH domain